MTTASEKPRTFTVRVGPRSLTYVTRPARALPGLLRVLLGALGALGGTLLPGAGTAAAQGVAADALPTGGSVAAGSAGISQTAGAMTVHQSSQRAILNWSTYNIGSQASVTYVQPGASSVALNRVADSAGASQILGRLSANGQVWLTNSSGVYFGRDATIHVGGLLASTLNANGDQFMAGRGVNLQRNGGTGTIHNEGTLNAASGGYIALIAPTVSNAGVINAPMGTVRMAAGDAAYVDLAGDGLVQLTIDKASAEAAVLNAGRLSADGGTVVLSAWSAGLLASHVVNNTGVIQARTLADRGGRIMLDGGTRGIVENSGALLATGAQAGERGGQIQLAGERVGVTGNGVVDASGDAGGGLVLMGGDYLGTGTRSIIDAAPVANAQVASVTEGATLRADALSAGDGGKLIVWSDQTTHLGGTLSARGGAASGHGGFVETSGKRVLNVYGSANVSASAAAGRAGTWLLDPQDIEITGDPTANATEAAGIYSNDGSASKTNLRASEIEFALRSGTDVTVLANGAAGSTGQGNIAVKSNLIMTSGTQAQLTLLAAHDVVVDSGVTLLASAGNVLGVTLSAGNNTDAANPTIGSVLIGDRAVINTGGGRLLIGGGGATTPGLAVAGSTVAPGVSIGANAQLTTGAGSVDIRGQGSGTLADGVGVLMNGASVTTTSGDIRITGIGGQGSGIALTGVQLATSSGSIQLTGQGGGTGPDAHGIVLANGTSATTQTGTFQFTGTGASGGTHGVGVRVDASSAEVNLMILGGTGTSNVVGVGGAAGTGNAGIEIATANSGRFGSLINEGQGTLNVVGTGGGNSGSGVVVAGERARILNSGDGTIQVTGLGSANGGSSDNNRGVWVHDSGSIAANQGSGTLVVTGQGGNSSGQGNTGIRLGDFRSALDAGTLSSAGHLTVSGVGGGSGALAFGLDLVGGSQILSSAAAGKTLAITGLGAAGGSTGAGGVRLIQDGSAQGAIRAQSADLHLTGVAGGSGGSGVGILLAGGVIMSASSKLDLKGTGGTAGSGNAGISLNGGSIDSYAGAMAVTGQGVGDASGSGNSGITLAGSSRIWVNTAVGVTGTVHGIGGSGTASHGIAVTGGTLTHAGQGLLTVTGTGSSSASSYGVFVSGSTASLSNELNGGLQVTGSGLAGGSANHGVVVDAGGTVRSIVNKGTLTVSGVSAGGAGSSGVVVRGTNASIGTKATSSLVVIGTGSTSGGSSHGVSIESGGTLAAAGNGIVAVTGLSRAADGSNNVGVQVSGSGSAIRSAGTGALSVTGTGGTGDGSDGVRVGTGGLLSVTGGGLALQGTAGSGGTGSVGAHVTGSNAVVQSTGEGRITAVGTGGTGGGSNRGISVEAGGKLQSTGIAGGVDLTGLASSSAANASYSGNQGVYIDGDVTTDRRALTVTGTGGAGASDTQGVWIGANGRVRSLNGDALRITGQAGSAASSNEGVRISGGMVSSNGASIAITGVAGGTGGPLSNSGVALVNGATISSAVASVFISGSAGAASRDIYMATGNNLVSATAAQVALLSSGTGGVQIGADGGADTATVSARTVTIQSTAGVQENAGGTLAASTGLVLAGRGIFHLDPGSGSNNVARLSASIAAGTSLADLGRALLVYRDADGFTIASQNAVTSGDVSGVLSSAAVDGIAVGAPLVGATAGGDGNSRVVLTAGGNVTQTSRIVTSQLNLQGTSGGAANFHLATQGIAAIDTGAQATTNNIDVLVGNVAASAGAGLVQYRDQDGFTVGSVAGGALHPFNGTALAADAATTGLSAAGNIWLLADVATDSAGPAPALAPDLVVASHITRTGSASASTLLRANRDILVLDGADIGSSGGRMDLILAADANAGKALGGRVLIRGTSGNAASIMTQGGSVVVGGGQFTSDGVVNTGALLGAAGRANPGSAADAVDDGVRLEHVQIGTGGGHVTLAGRGDDTTASAGQHLGIAIVSSGWDTAGGTISLTGTGGAGGADGHNAGVLLEDSQLSTGAGAVRITGLGGTGAATANDGIVLRSATVTTAGGSQSYAGTAHGTGSLTRGVLLQGSMLGATASGSVSLTGNASAGSTGDGNQGVLITGTAGGVSSMVSTAGADITILATGGTGSGTGNRGFELGGGSTVTSATGNICIDATASAPGAADLYIGTGSEGAGSGGVNLLAISAPGATSQLALIGRGATGGIQLGRDAADVASLVLAPRISLVSAHGVKQYTGTLARDAGGQTPAAAELLVSGKGEFLLERSSNDFSAVAARIGDAGAVKARLVLGEANGFSIGTVTGCETCALTQATLSGITVGGSAGDLVEGPASGHQVVLNTRSGEVTQSADGAVVTGQLLLLGGASYLLGSAANDVDVLAARLGSAGRLSLRDVDALMIGSVQGNGLANVNTPSPSGPYEAAGLSAASVSLATGSGAIASQAAVVAQEVSLSSTGEVRLVHAGNDFGTVRVTTPGRVQLSDRNDITVTGVAASRIDVRAGGDVAIESGGSVNMGTISGRRVHVTAERDITDANGRDNNITAGIEATLIARTGTIITTPTPDLAPNYLGIIAPTLSAYAGGVTTTERGSRVSIDVWGQIGNGTILMLEPSEGQVYLNGRRVGEQTPGVQTAIQSWQSSDGTVSMAPALSEADRAGALTYGTSSVRDVLENAPAPAVTLEITRVHVDDGGIRLPPGVTPATAQPRLMQLVPGGAAINLPDGSVATLAGNGDVLISLPVNGLAGMAGSGALAQDGGLAAVVITPAGRLVGRDGTGQPMAVETGDELPPALRQLLEQIADLLPPAYRERWKLRRSAAGAGTQPAAAEAPSRPSALASCVIQERNACSGG